MTSTLALEERNEQLRQLWQEGLPAVEIGRRLGISASTVYWYRAKMGLSARDSVRPGVEIWSPEQKAWLSRLINDGHPFSYIGKTMGITKDAAIGKAYRMGLVHPNTHPPTRGRTLAVTANRAETFTFPDRDHCVFPHGDPGEEGFGFCGVAVPIRGLPYCAEHMRIAYQEGTSTTPMRKVAA